MLKKQDQGKNTCLPPSQWYSMWGHEPGHSYLGGKQGGDHPDFRKKTVTFGEKELPREGHTLSDGQRLQQTLRSLCAGAERQRPRHTIPRGPRSLPGAPVGLEAQATCRASGLSFKVLQLTSDNHPNWQWGTLEPLRGVAERLIGT